ncbi:hypothetical protein HDU98_001447 [Podochytrium sp. JEL0797]|nr:hypothetical protein HDU98_001447 [Podochytrium sp. JEL0797]
MVTTSKLAGPSQTNENIAGITVNDIVLTKNANPRKRLWVRFLIAAVAVTCVVGVALGLYFGLHKSTSVSAINVVESKDGYVSQSSSFSTVTTSAYQPNVVGFSFSSPPSTFTAEPGYVATSSASTNLGDGYNAAPASPAIYVPPATQQLPTTTSCSTTSTAGAASSYIDSAGIYVTAGLPPQPTGSSSAVGLTPPQKAKTSVSSSAVSPGPTTSGASINATACAKLNGLTGIGDETIFFATDVDNCGSCGNICPDSTTTGYCDGGVCYQQSTTENITETFSTNAATAINQTVSLSKEVIAGNGTEPTATYIYLASAVGNIVHLSSPATVASFDPSLGNSTLTGRALKRREYSSHFAVSPVHDMIAARIIPDSTLLEENGLVIDGCVSEVVEQTVSIYCEAAAPEECLQSYEHIRQGYRDRASQHLNRRQDNGTNGTVSSNSVGMIMEMLDPVAYTTNDTQEVTDIFNDENSNSTLQKRWSLFGLIKTVTNLAPSVIRSAKAFVAGVQNAAQNFVDALASGKVGGSSQVKFEKTFTKTILAANADCGATSVNLDLSLSGQLNLYAQTSFQLIGTLLPPKVQSVQLSVTSSGSNFMLTETLTGSANFSKSYPASYLFNSPIPNLGVKIPKIASVGFFVAAGASLSINASFEGTVSASQKINLPDISFSIGSLTSQGNDALRNSTIPASPAASLNGSFDASITVEPSVIVELKVQMAVFSIGGEAGLRATAAAGLTVSASGQFSTESDSAPVAPTVTVALYARSAASVYAQVKAPWPGFSQSTSYPIFDTGNLDLYGPTVIGSKRDLYYSYANPLDKRGDGALFTLTSAELCPK